jgi:hypothetical protein
MTTAYTSLLGLALPVTGELSGTWGDTVNTAITSLLDTAIAGTTSITTDADITLSTTTGASNQARQAIILWNPASGTTTRNITAPAQSKMYVVINASGGTQSIVIRGAGPTTGVTIAKGESATVAWNGSDFVKVSSSGGAITFTDLTVTGNTILGDAAADTLTVNATSTFASPVSFAGLVRLPSTGRSAAAALTVTAPAFLYGVASTYTDTTSSGTIAAMAPFYSIAQPTLSTSNVTTYTNAATLYLANAPVAGGSATITNPYALYIAAGANYFGGATTFNSTTQFNGVATHSANVLFSADNTYDIGATGATRPRTLYLGTSLVTPSITDSGLTSGRVTFATTGGLLTDSAALTFDGASLKNTGGTNAQVGVYAANSTSPQFVLGNAAGTAQWSIFQTLGAAGQQGSFTIYDVVAAASRLIINTSGNFGLGIAPSTSNLGRVVELGSVQGNALWGIGINACSLLSNASYNSGYVYANNGYANRYDNGGGSGFHAWYTAPSGTAGAAITFTQALTLDPNGKLLLGVTSGTGLSNGDFAMANGNHIRFRNAANSAYISAFEFTSANGLNIGTGGSLYNITFGISGIGEVARFNNGTGYLGLFNQNPGAMLDVGPTASPSIPAAILRGGAGIGNTGGLGLYTNDSSATARNWGIVSNSSSYGDFSIRQGNALFASPFSAGVDRLYINNGGQVVINNGTTPLSTAILTVAATAGTGSNVCLTLQTGVTTDGYGAIIFRNQAGQQGAMVVNTDSIGMSGVAGITFKAAQVANADPNTLDDYEEGTFTPTITYETPGTLSITYNNTTGRYIKIGRLVYINIDVRIAGFTKGTASGPWGFTGLPFGTFNTGGYNNFNTTSVQFYNASYNTSNFPLSSLNSNGGTVVYMYTMVSGAVNGNQNDPSNGAIYQMTLFYETAT